MEFHSGRVELWHTRLTTSGARVAGGPAVLPGLLSSLEDGLRGLRWHLTVADNASADDSVAVAQRMVPGCRIEQTGRNAGYAAAFNAAVRSADPYDAVLILNPDVRLRPGSVATLMARLGG